MKRTHVFDWRFAVLALLIVTLACNLSLPKLPGPKPTATPQPLPPALVETDPPTGSQLPLNTKLVFYFNQPMDDGSVKSAINGLPQGTFTWIDDATLTYTPSDKLAPASNLTVNIAESAKAANGLSLVSQVSLDFTTADYLRVTQLLPETGAQETLPNSAIVASFNQPVVALGADQAGLPPAFYINPSANGKGEWINTSTYVFYPDPALDGGATYTANINSVLTSVSNAPLESAPAWSFSTALPKVVSIEPVTETPIPLDAPIKLTFNQPMDPASVESNFNLFENGTTTVIGKASWDEKNTIFIFTPTANLKRNTFYTIFLSGGTHSAGGAPLGDHLSVQVVSVADFAVTSTDPAADQVKTQYGAAILYFSAPIKQVDFSKFITISPEVSNPYFYASDYDLNVYADWQPGQNYTITVGSQLSDNYGQTLGAPYSLNFHTDDAGPTITFSYINGDTYMVRPNNAVLGAQATNISDVTTSITAISLADFIKLTGPNSYDLRQNFFPSYQNTFTQSVTLPRNKSENVGINLTSAGSSLTTGLYYYQLKVSGVENQYYPPFIASTDVNITLKTSPTEALVWATDLRSDGPLAGAKVVLYDNTGASIASGVTNQDGIWRAPVDATSNYDRYLYAVIGQPGDADFGIATSTWNSSVEAWNFGIATESRGKHPYMYLYTDRPIYRAGQTVYFKGVARQQFDGRYTEKTDKQVELNLNGPQGLITTVNLPLSEYGTFDGSYQLSENAAPGYYYFDSQEYQVYLGFNVAQYRKPEVNLSVTLSPQESKAGSALTGKVDASYFFGAPAGNLNVQWTLYARDDNVYVPGYRTGVADTSWLSPYGRFFGGFGSGYLGQSILNGEGKTGPDGTLTLPFKDLPEATSKQTLTLEATVADESGLATSARGSVTVHPADYYVAVTSNAWVGQAKQALGFSFLSVNWKNKPAGNQSLNVDFSSVTWERKQINLYDVKFIPTYTSISTVSITTNANGQAEQSFTPPTAGTYMLKVSGTNVAQTETLVWVGGEEQAVFPNLVSNRLQLTTDGDSYKAGDTARVFVPNPFGKPTRALVTLERGIISDVRTISLPAGGGSVSIPLTAENEPNIYVSVTLMGEQNQFKQGFVNLNVAPESLTLNVEVTATPENASPGDEVTLDVRVTDNQGKPVQGELSLAVVDLSVLALADPNSEDIVKAFYDTQPLEVNTTMTLANFAQRDLLQPAGGGGGGGGDEFTTVREKFLDTALWSAHVVTNADGRASVNLTLPDNLTTWQIDARGLDKSTRVGSAVTQIMTSKDLLIRPVTPRFLVTGDHAELSALVNNNTSNDVEASVSLTGTGFKLDDMALATQSVSVPANGRARVAWMGTADDAANADLVFSVQGGGLQDASRLANGALPILRYTAPQAFTTAGVLPAAGAQLELISPPRSFVPTSGSLDVELSPSLGATVLSGLKSLETPDQAWSAEQVISYFLPNLFTYRTLKDSGINDDALSATLQRQVEEGIQQLVRLQNYDGSWGWQVNGQSDAYISAYALFSLQMAKDAGFTVLDYSLENARNYLSGPAQAPLINDTTNWELNRAAFMAYALQLSGGVDPFVLNSLYDFRNRLDPWAQALLALVIESANNSDARAKDLISNLETTAVRTSTGVHWKSASGDYHNPGTPLHTSAMVVYAIARRDPASPLLADATRYLVSNRDASGLWGSAYETSWVIMALNQVMKGTGELNAAFDYSASLNGTQLLAGSAAGPTTLTPVSANQPLTTLNPLAPNSLSISRTDGPGRLYYRAALTVYRPVELVAPLNAGMQITRSYFDAACEKDCTPLTAVQISQTENVRVRLTLTLPNDAYYVNVQDYIPAGSEIFNTNIKTTAQGEGDGTQVIIQFDDDDPYATGWGWWLFGDARMYDDHIAWSADYLTAGTYQLTYTLTPLQTGQYRVLPARAWMQYFPEVQGTSGGNIFEIKP